MNDMTEKKNDKTEKMTAKIKTITVNIEDFHLDEYVKYNDLVIKKITLENQLKVVEQEIKNAELNMLLSDNPFLNVI